MNDYRNFQLNIRLGNDQMQTLEDVAEALQNASERIRNGHSETGIILDANGNQVGFYEFMSAGPN